MLNNQNAFQGFAGSNDAEQFAELQKRYVQQWQRLWEQAKTGDLPELKDRRFADPAWQSNPVAKFNAHVWELGVQAMRDMLDLAQIEPAQRERLDFSLMQWAEAMSPSNYLLLNPQAMQAAVDSGGQSVLQGMRNFLGDMQKGRMTQTDESQFELGRNVATTAGAVVYQNDLFQLIQYAPTTTMVHAVPLLIVPPCINKFYILDLQESNSFVRHAVDQGMTVYLMSWRNPQPADGAHVQSLDWQDYMEQGVLEAIRVSQELSGQDKINTLGFCIGGTLLASALALAHDRGQDPAASMTLLTTMLDFSDVGVLNVFIDQAHVAFREWQLGQGGLLNARELASTFSFLRPAELVWNYVSSNYLQGKTPPAFDLLYWNSDGTHLPGPFFTWYLRNTYLENRLVQPGGVRFGDHCADLAKLDLPVYVYGSRDDHIVPWQSAYASLRALPAAQHRFVLGASGHIAGVINPPAKQRRNFWVGQQTQGEASVVDPEQWMAQAQSVPGSWWPDWIDWLKPLSGSRKRARRTLGHARYPVLEAAPGSYVKVRAQ
ncbi:MAG TPA: class I poly(R)-hydroxyalkanoic acid synthase [Alcaligenes sp.]|nr:class I poly(R)-hydroxyalkanoic acid synthase [Alcaligenes sp.]HRL26547.1 class I poly(R)-hydroxyalkanoic acid synthase [Alcaligenes sp.]